MATCEKCWREAGGNPYRYEELISTRPPCTPEESAGPDAGRCPVCGRMTLHQHCGDCMACGYKHPEPIKIKGIPLNLVPSAARAAEARALAQGAKEKP